MELLRQDNFKLRSEFLNMSDTLNKKEIKKLIELGKRIQLGLSCDINGQGIPCRTDRLQAVDDMIEYLKIHDYYIGHKKDLIQYS